MFSGESFPRGQMQSVHGSSIVFKAKTQQQQQQNMTRGLDNLDL